MSEDGVGPDMEHIAVIRNLLSQDASRLFGIADTGLTIIPIPKSLPQYASSCWPVRPFSSGSQPSQRPQGATDYRPVSAVQTDALLADNRLSKLQACAVFSQVDPLTGKENVLSLYASRACNPAEWTTVQLEASVYTLHWAVQKFR
jgi:hypothetical protein